MRRGENLRQPRDARRPDLDEQLRGHCLQVGVFVDQCFQQSINGGRPEAQEFVGGRGAFGGVA
jgi:hypothetical protein